MMVKGSAPWVRTLALVWIVLALLPRQEFPCSVNPKFGGLSSYEKETWMWRRVLATQVTGVPASAGVLAKLRTIALLFWRNHNAMFNCKAADVRPGEPICMAARHNRHPTLGVGCAGGRKIIHSHGAVARCQWDHGLDHWDKCLLRVSSALPAGRKIYPALSIKLLSSHYRSSRNFVAVVSASGQRSCNWSTQLLSTTVPLPNKLPLVTLDAKLRITGNPSNSGLCVRDLATGARLMVNWAPYLLFSWSPARRHR